MQMSTVLRPVGPLPPRIYWIRRGVMLLVIFIVILVVALSCSGGGGGATPSAGPTTTPKTTASSQPTQCTAASLKLTLSTDQTTYSIGSPATFTGTFTNTSTTPCTMTLSPANETWTVTSGTPTIWTNAHCQSSQTARVTTIRPNGTRHVSIQWDGKVQAAGTCTPASEAQSGVYVVRASLDGVTAPTGAVFHITPSGQ
jgi:cytoskeletal protein RodZ